uniref:hypothetical protein n=1 Tax=Thaumasiovibrio occultus TaxID=1891184 RepID=UPI000B34CB96|nr:hypothetical protein [Thaumasiovibrio occultus]
MKYTLLPLLFLSFSVSAESTVRDLLSDLVRAHYEQVGADTTKREIQNLDVLSKVNDALEAGDIEAAQQLLLVDMAKSAYVISESGHFLTVEGGKNEAQYALHRFELYMSTSPLFVNHPDANEHIRALVQFPETIPAGTGRDPEFHKRFGDIAFALFDELE